MRAAHPAFQMDDPAAIKKHLKFLKSKTFALGFELSGNANKDKWKNIVVIYNPLRTAVSFSLPKGPWTIDAKGAKIGQKSLGKATSKVSVPAYSAMVLHQ
jgi:pullulanase